MTMPQAVALALARSRVYAVLSRGFLYPSGGLVAAMGDFRGTLQEALAGVGVDEPIGLELTGMEEAYQALFAGQTPPCPPCETEYTASHVWMQTQQMADIAGFYRAFGVDTQDVGERCDNLAAELEFMYMLCVKEAIAENDGDHEAVMVCRDAEAKFLREHLTVWLPRFVTRLEKAGAEGDYPALARLAERFAQADAARFPREVA